MISYLKKPIIHSLTISITLILISCFVFYRELEFIEEVGLKGINEHFDNFFIFGMVIITLFSIISSILSSIPKFSLQIFNLLINSLITFFLLFSFISSFTLKNYIINGFFKPKLFLSSAHVQLKCCGWITHGDSPTLVACSYKSNCKKKIFSLYEERSSNYALLTSFLCLISILKNILIIKNLNHFSNYELLSNNEENFL